MRSPCPTGGQGDGSSNKCINAKMIQPHAESAQHDSRTSSAYAEDLLSMDDFLNEGVDDDSINI